VDGAVRGTRCLALDDVAIERGAVDLRGAPAGEESAERFEALLGFLRIARARRRVVGRELLGELVKAHVLQPHNGQALTRAREPIAEHALGRLALRGARGLAHRASVDVELRPPGGSDRAVAAALLEERTAPATRARRTATLRLGR